MRRSDEISTRTGPEDTKLKYMIWRKNSLMAVQRNSVRLPGIWIFLEINTYLYYEQTECSERRFQTSHLILLRRPWASLGQSYFFSSCAICGDKSSLQGTSCFLPVPQKKVSFFEGSTVSSSTNRTAFLPSAFWWIPRGRTSRLILKLLGQNIHSNLVHLRLLCSPGWSNSQHFHIDHSESGFHLKDFQLIAEMA